MKSSTFLPISNGENVNSVVTDKFLTRLLSNFPQSFVNGLSMLVMSRYTFSISILVHNPYRFLGKSLLFMKQYFTPPFLIAYYSILVHNLHEYFWLKHQAVLPFLYIEIITFKLSPGILKFNILSVRMKESVVFTYTFFLSCDATIYLLCLSTYPTLLCWKWWNIICNLANCK